MTFLLGLTLGLFIGASLGLFTACLLLTIPRDEDDDLVVPADWDTKVGGTE